jgi:hypothetical protein
VPLILHRTHFCLFFFLFLSLPLHCLCGMFTELYEMMVQCKLCTHGNACSLVLFVGVDFVSGLGKIFEVF